MATWMCHFLARTAGKKTKRIESLRPYSDINDFTALFLYKIYKFSSQMALVKSVTEAVLTQEHRSNMALHACPCIYTKMFRFNSVRVMR